MVKRASRIGTAGESHQADQVVGPAVEMFAIGTLAAGHEQAKRPLDRFEPVDAFAAPVEVRLRHAAADIDDDLDGDPFGGNAAGAIGPAQPGNAEHQADQGDAAQDRAAPMSDRPATDRQGSEQTHVRVTEGGLRPAQVPPKYQRHRKEQQQEPGVCEVNAEDAQHEDSSGRRASKHPPYPANETPASNRSAPSKLCAAPKWDRNPQGNEEMRPLPAYPVFSGWIVPARRWSDRCQRMGHFEGLLDQARFDKSLSWHTIFLSRVARQIEWKKISYFAPATYMEKVLAHPRLTGRLLFPFPSPRE